MKDIVGVRFKDVGKIYYFDPVNLEVYPGNEVIVDTIRGQEYGQVVTIKQTQEDQDYGDGLKPLIRIATKEDHLINEENKKREAEAFEICKEKIKVHGLDMKLLTVEYTFDRNKLIFSFSAEQRVDFRELVKDLASIFHTRIELRQVGVRDEAKVVGGLASCGRNTCCSSWKGGFDTVSIKMAKNQELALNPTKLSGICGRLMCCLKYEEPVYLELKRSLPKQGQRVNFEEQSVEVTSLNILSQKVKVKVYDEEDDSYGQQWVKAEDVGYGSKG